ncbi:lipopolysaccharide biosynthesis protein [Allofustis seminis]|uniref:lipopolysaccharide biosynthesis protein n=1 Tax=Allofustis seminis TaxID=166939 RepID=UPI0003614C69|nr:oligosaccharide flippase family protein [Allofustis seminis]
MNRTKNTIRNSLWGIIYRIVTLIGPFVIKTIIIRELGIQYNGLNGLFTSILTVLNLTNLGFSSSLVYMMYQAVADNDSQALSAMLNYFKKVHRTVGFIILTMGVALIPFLNVLVKGDVPSDLNLQLLFFIFLMEVVFDYILFSYNTALFTAHQRDDVILKIQTVRYIIQYTLQAAVLAIFKDYYIYAILLPIMVAVNSVGYLIESKKMYPHITCEGDLTAEQKETVYQKVATLFGHNVGNTFLVSVDSIIISSYLGLITVSIYSNYNYILVAVNGLIQVFTGGSLSAIGNKLITDSKEDNYHFFLLMNYVWMGLVGVSAAFMLSLYQPFIYAWAGPEYILNDFIVYFVVLYFYSWMFRIMMMTYRNAGGLWNIDWLKPYVGMIINLVGSIWMVKTTQSIIGVLVPTIFVFFFVYFPWEAAVVIKNEFDESLRHFFAKVVYLFGVTFLGVVTSYWVSCTISPAYGLASFALRFLVVLVIFPLIWIAGTYRSQEFKTTLEYAAKYIGGPFKK